MHKRKSLITNVDKERNSRLENISFPNEADRTEG